MLTNNLLPEHHSKSLRTQISDFNADHERIRNSLLALEKASTQAKQQLEAKFLQRLSELEDTLVAHRQMLAKNDDKIRAFRAAINLKTAQLERVAKREALILQGKDVGPEPVSSNDLRTQLQALQTNDAGSGSLFPPPQPQSLKPPQPMQMQQQMMSNANMPPIMQRAYHDLFDEVAQECNDDEDDNSSIGDSDTE